LSDPINELRNGQTRSRFAVDAGQSGHPAALAISAAFKARYTVNFL
jgi:hypothetical protein